MRRLKLWILRLFVVGGLGAFAFGQGRAPQYRAVLVRAEQSVSRKVKVPYSDLERMTEALNLLASQGYEPYMITDQIIIARKR